MCTLNRKEFTLCRQCKETLKKSSTPPRTILDSLIPIYGINTIKLVLAATVLRNDTVMSANYPDKIVEWSKKYENKIGYMKNCIGIKKASIGKISQLIELSKKLK
jgi:hypothetical protein